VAISTRLSVSTRGAVFICLGVAVVVIETLALPLPQTFVSLVFGNIGKVGVGGEAERVGSR